MGDASMNETQWLADDRPKMLEYLHKRASERKRRLFAAACCRRIWHLLGDERSEAAVVMAERFAEGEVGRAALLDAEGAAQDAYAVARDASESVAMEARNAVYCVVCSGVGWDIADVTAGAVVDAVVTGMKAPRKQRQSIQQDEIAAQVVLLRCVFGNPFRPVAFDPAWRIPLVKQLAQAAYEQRALPTGELNADRLAVLADALEEAGCNEQSALDHLRGPGLHVRGCWPLDLVLKPDGGGPLQGLTGR